MSWFTIISSFFASITATVITHWTLVVKIMTIASCFFLTLDLLEGNCFGAIYSALSIAGVPLWDFTSFDTGDVMLDSFLGVFNTYIPVSQITNALAYVFTVEAALLTFRGVVAIYKLIPLKFT